MIPFNSAPGDLFNRLGSLGGLVENMASYQQTQLTALTDTTTGVVSEYNSESDLQALIGSTYISTLNAVGSIGSLASNVAVQTVNRMCFRDNPRIAQNLQSVNFLASIQEVIRQMGVQGATVLQMPVSVTTNAFTGTGDGTINVSLYRPQDGRTQELAFAETLLFSCTQDSYIGGATEGNEGFTVTGVGSQGNVYAFDWPLGSNSTQTVNAIDGNVSNGSGNLLANSGFADWTVANIPDQFVLDVGTAGTDIAEETTIVYDGSTSSLRIIGDGSTLVELSQEFGDGTTGTSDTLEPLTQYSFNLFIRRDGLAPSQGILTVRLVDQNDTVLVDAAATPNSFDIDLTLLNTVFTAYKGTFRTPLIMPETTYLELALTIALENGRSVYVDKMSLGGMTQMYKSGPYVAVHSGGTPFTQGDYTTAPVTNSRGAAGTLNTFQTLFQRFFFDTMMSNELLLPSVAAAPSISDALIG